MSVWFLVPVPLLLTRAMLTTVSMRMTEFTCDKVKVDIQRINEAHLAINAPTRPIFNMVECFFYLLDILKQYNEQQVKKNIPKLSYQDDSQHWTNKTPNKSLFMTQPTAAA